MSASTKIQITCATLLAAQVSAHGYIDSSRNFRCYVFQNQFDYPMSMPPPNAAENRLGDEHFLACTTSAGKSGRQHGKGECVEISAICPLASFWSTVGDPRDSEWCKPSRRDIRLGCCAGYQETVFPMRIFEHAMSNGKQTSCWAGNTGIPTALDTTLPTFNGHAALLVDNLKPREKYVAGGVFEFSWIATAQHGGAIEVGIVCDGDESYANFAANR